MTLHSPRHPLRRKAGWTALVVASVSVGVGFGGDAAELEHWATVGGQIITALTGLGVLVKSGEHEVTPNSDPRAPDGTPLHPAKPTTDAV